MTRQPKKSKNKTKQNPKAQICSVCQFPWSKRSRHGHFQASSTDRGAGERSAGPAPRTHAAPSAPRPQPAGRCLLGLSRRLRLPRPAENRDRAVLCSGCFPRCQDPDPSLSKRASAGELVGSHTRGAKCGPERGRIYEARAAAWHRRRRLGPGPIYSPPGALGSAALSPCVLIPARQTQVPSEPEVSSLSSRSACECVRHVGRRAWPAHRALRGDDGCQVTDSRFWRGASR